MNEGYGEIVDRDSIQLGELIGVLLRSKLLIAGVIAITVSLSALWIGTRSPRYVARATLLLEADEAAGGVLSEIASLTSDPAAESEIALIKSRSLATVTAARSDVFGRGDEVFFPTEPDFDPFATVALEAGTNALELLARGDPSAMENLGLATVVDRHDLRPFASIWSKLTSGLPLEHRLRAWIDEVPLGGPEPEIDLTSEAIDVMFVDEDTVRITRHDGYLFAASGGDVFEFEPAAPLEVFGIVLRLVPTGDYVGHRYTIHRYTQQDAIERLLANTIAIESGRKTNVVFVSVEDSDPYRAAEVANALCKNYIRRSVRIGQQKASQTVRFIEAQLTVQLNALAEAEREVVRLQTKYPETIALSESASAWIEQLSAFELQRTQIELAQAVLSDAIHYLDEGDLHALARLGQETPNLFALSYIQELGRLESESLRLDRTDVAGYKALLIAERLRLESEIDAHELRIAQLVAGVRSLKAGDAGAAASFGSGTGEGEFAGYLEELASLDAEIGRMRGTATEKNPTLLALETGRSELIMSLTLQVEGALSGARTMVENHRALVADYARSIEEWPASERGTIEEAVKKLRQQVRASLVSQSAGLTDQTTAIEGQMHVVDRRLSQLPVNELELAEPMRRREARSQIVAFLLTSNQEAKITAAATSAAAVLIDPAVPPLARAFPKATTFLGLGLVLGVLLGCGAAFVRSSLRGALHSEAEVERASGLAVLGAVPDYKRGRTRVKGVRRNDRFLAMRDDPRGSVAEAYRAIRASLRLAMDGEDALRTLAVTSCVPGEGKTVTNADLAMVFATAGRRVLFVDADLRKPQVHNLFGVERSPGFAEVLEGTVQWPDCVRDVGFENLQVISAGQSSAEPGELLAGERSLHVLDELSAEYDLVVVDLPPAVVVADVASFAHKLDALILLYRSGGVQGRLLTRAVSKLKQSNVNLMGVILNAVYVARGPGGYGEYGYGYGYGEDGDKRS